MLSSQEGKNIVPLGWLVSYWGSTCLNVSNLLITAWCRAAWFAWDLPFAFVMICVGWFGWRQGFYLCFWLFYPALYSNALIWHTYLYSVSRYGFLIKNKFPGILFAVLGVGTKDWSCVFSHQFFVHGALLQLGKYVTFNKVCELRLEYQSFHFHAHLWLFYVYYIFCLYLTI